ncbi:HesA/MoeB/ThiF family protein [Chryseobacterium oryctis]|uniref:ThiF family adenylyltransferase n=1 Tax=Chryseobacterium oryctis TaxID=2952618 RepID=A0ABT3HPG4_9FLAO|nr:ThiF family adenylyltransferase [Chryseobacterium oryctis]MCW3161639.1 ThiF family adenylyltransferase [Chryseobacterium oryctis]
MEERYSRNRLYINEEEQEAIKSVPILFAGSGIGSNIAECALRIGFENITIVDGDTVELSNLNRQNYTEKDISEYKSKALYERLKSINPNADIKYIQDFITFENIEKIIEGHEIAVNALDFTSNIPLYFDELCRKSNIPVVHPYNLGWAGLVAVISPTGPSLNSISNDEKFNELKMVEYVTGYLRFWEKRNVWLEEIIKSYKAEEEVLPPPQLSIGSWIVGAMCANIMFNIATEKGYKRFPEFYFSSIM